LAATWALTLTLTLTLTLRRRQGNSPLEITLYRSQHWRGAGDNRESVRIRYAAQSRPAAVVLALTLIC
jgi:hypothetical protein